MRRPAQAGFLLKYGEIRADILNPRYYDPRIAAELSALERTHTLETLTALELRGQLQHDHGKYIPKIHYGTGPYPYIRTSDISNWEMRASPKHGVARAVYDAYHQEMDVEPRDILFVHEGTYLIGSSALVTAFDGPMLYQHHLAKFRLMPTAPLSPYFLLAALGSPIVQMQIRSKQFSADIIDSVVGRVGEIAIPIPRDRTRHDTISARVKTAVEGRASARERISHLFKFVNDWLSGQDASDLEEGLGWQPDPDEYSGRPVFLGRRGHFQSFRKRSSEIFNDVLIPKYYDPELQAERQRFEDRCSLISISDLIFQGTLALDTGDEIGRLSYGTGTIPFIRTSDLGTFELKLDAKHGVSVEVYDQFREMQDIEANDIFIVRDGTYLVGSSTIVFSEDIPLLYCGGINKLRSLQTQSLTPYLLFALLNLPFVREQMRRKQFTRDIIDTLGHRLQEVVLPIPRDPAVKQQISDAVESLCRERVDYRTNLNVIVQSLYRRDDDTEE